jgi:hypothetical protein
LRRKTQTLATTRLAVEWLIARLIDPERIPEDPTQAFQTLIGDRHTRNEDDILFDAALQVLLRYNPNRARNMIQRLTNHLTAASAVTVSAAAIPTTEEKEAAAAVHARDLAEHRRRRAKVERIWLRRRNRNLTYVEYRTQVHELTKLLKNYDAPVMDMTRVVDVDGDAVKVRIPSKPRDASALLAVATEYRQAGYNVVGYDMLQRLAELAPKAAKQSTRRQKSERERLLVPVQQVRQRDVEDVSLLPILVVATQIMATLVVSTVMLLRRGIENCLSTCNPMALLQYIGTVHEYWYATDVPPVINDLAFHIKSVCSMACTSLTAFGATLKQPYNTLWPPFIVARRELIFDKISDAIVAECYRRKPNRVLRETDIDWIIWNLTEIGSFVAPFSGVPIWQWCEVRSRHRGPNGQTATYEVVLNHQSTFRDNSRVKRVVTEWCDKYFGNEMFLYFLSDAWDDALSPAGNYARAAWQGITFTLRPTRVLENRPFDLRSLEALDINYRMSLSSSFDGIYEYGHFIWKKPPTEMPACLICLDTVGAVGATCGAPLEDAHCYYHLDCLRQWMKMPNGRRCCHCQQLISDTQVDRVQTIGKLEAFLSSSLSLFDLRDLRTIWPYVLPAVEEIVKMHFGWHVIAVPELFLRIFVYCMTKPLTVDAVMVAIILCCFHWLLSLMPLPFAVLLHTLYNIRAYTVRRLSLFELCVHTYHFLEEKLSIWFARFMNFWAWLCVTAKTDDLEVPLEPLGDVNVDPDTYPESLRHRGRICGNALVLELRVAGDLVFSARATRLERFFYGMFYGETLHRVTVGSIVVEDERDVRPANLRAAQPAHRPRLLRAARYEQYYIPPVMPTQWLVECVSAPLLEDLLSARANHFGNYAAVHHEYLTATSMRCSANVHSNSLEPMIASHVLTICTLQDRVPGFRLAADWSMFMVNWLRNHPWFLISLILALLLLGALIGGTLLGGLIIAYCIVRLRIHTRPLSTTSVQQMMLQLNITELFIDLVPACLHLIQMSAKYFVFMLKSCFELFLVWVRTIFLRLSAGLHTTNVAQPTTQTSSDITISSPDSVPETPSVNLSSSASPIQSPSSLDSSTLTETTSSHTSGLSVMPLTRSCLHCLSLSNIFQKINGLNASGKVLALTLFMWLTFLLWNVTIVMISPSSDTFGLVMYLVKCILSLIFEVSLRLFFVAVLSCVLNICMLVFVVLLCLVLLGRRVLMAL